MRTWDWDVEFPHQYAAIKKGDHILDLASGAGNDCFVARTFVGETGMVTGIDFTDEMLKKANENLKKTGFRNIQFVKGDIENMPLPNSTYDVVISNCVLNMVPDKSRAFSEILRVLNFLLTLRKRQKCMQVVSQEHYRKQNTWISFENRDFIIWTLKGYMVSQLMQ